MKNRNRKFFFFTGILKKFMIGFLCIFAVPVLVLYFSLYYTSSRMMVSDAEKQMLATLKNISDTIDEVFRSIDFMQRQMQADPVFSELSFDATLRKGQETYVDFLMKERIKKAVYTYYLSNSYLYSLEVYNPYINTLFSSKTGETLRMIPNPPESLVSVFKGGERKEDGSWNIQKLSDGTLQFERYFMPFSANNPSERLYAKCTVRDIALLNRLQQNYSDAAVFSFSITRPPNTSYEIIGPPFKPEKNKLPVFEQTAGSMTEKKGGNFFISAYFYSQYTQWYYVLTMPLSYFNSSVVVIKNYQYYFSFAIVLVFIISMVFSYFFIIKPLQYTSKIMRLAEAGDLSARIIFERNDEIGYIAGRFNALLENIETLIYQNYKTKLLKQEFELKFIQNQLKEHFIYNTLDSIHWIAAGHKIPAISKIIFDLSKFFRLTLNQGSDIIPVDQVEVILASYIALLNVRMDNMIQFDISVQQEIKNSRVIKYIFQPLVENSVVHGVQPNQGGKISVRLEGLAGNKIRYTVEDNGRGIPSDELERIRACLHNDVDNQVYFALTSINRQLKLYFDTDYSFIIESEEGRGTKVVIEFPES